MNRIPWAFLPAAAWRGPLELVGDEAHHLAGVLRLRPGATVTLFDGQGKTMQCVVRQGLRRGVLTLEGLEPGKDHPRPVGPILAPAWTKGGRRGFTVEKAVELGAQGVWFWRAARSQGTIPPDAPAAWHRQAVAAAKQCQSPWLPELRALSNLTALVTAAQQIPRRCVLWEEASPEALLHEGDLLAPCLMAIGPEGGLTSAEIASLTSHGWQARSLGQRILRAETAGLCVLALAWYGHQRLQNTQGLPGTSPPSQGGRMRR